MVCAVGQAIVNHLLKVKGGLSDAVGVECGLAQLVEEVAPVGQEGDPCGLDVELAHQVLGGAVCSEGVEEARP